MISDVVEVISLQLRYGDAELASAVALAMYNCMTGTSFMLQLFFVALAATCVEVTFGLLYVLNM